MSVSEFRRYAALRSLASRMLNAEQDTTLAAQRQREGAASFDASWKDLLACLATTRATPMQPDLTTSSP